MAYLSKLFSHHDSEFFKGAQKLTLWFLAFNIPLVMITAWLSEMSVMSAFIVSLLVLAGPLFVRATSKNEALIAATCGVAMMSLSGVLIHFGKGMIELHFHVFVGIALLIVLAHPLAIFSAALTIALHHIGFYFLFKSSAFSEETDFKIVLLHAFFVIFESVPALLIASKVRNFVISQEGFVQNFDQVSEQLKQVSTSNQKASQGLLKTCQIQKQSIEQVEESTQQINDQIDQSKHSIAESVQELSLFKQKHNECKANVDQLIAEISKMNDSLQAVVLQFNSNVESLAKIENKVSNISAKTQIINEIVFQTKLLSFNASIEAARAGEHGKGFSVVAHEIGQLAKVSGESSNLIYKDIEETVALIEQIKKETEANLASQKKKVQANLSSAHSTQMHFTNSFEAIHSAIKTLEETVINIQTSNQELISYSSVIIQQIEHLKEANQDTDEVVLKTGQSTEVLSQKIIEINSIKENFKAYLKVG